MPIAHPMPALPGAQPCPHPESRYPWRGRFRAGGAPRQPLSADERRAWLARADQERRAGRLTGLHLDVARAVLGRLGEDGRCDPAYVTLAADAECSVRTVPRALAALREAGLLSWTSHPIRTYWPGREAGGQRAEQISNRSSYLLHLPETPVAPRGKP